MPAADPLRQLKQTAILYLVIAVLLIAVLIKYNASTCLLPLVVGVIIYLFFSRAVKILFRVSAVDRDQIHEFQRTFRQQFERQNLPRQIFYLLFAVAEVDGKSETEERELVRKFLLERFTDPATYADLRSWEATRIPPEQIVPLALGLARVLTVSERETVFAWCCRVAFADSTYKTEEHIILQQIARSFNFEGDHARRIFHFAKSQHLNGDAGGGGDPWGQRGQYQGGPNRAQGAVRSRGQALATLGLGDGATQDEIRRRHRELVREYHPDKHQHLGEVAAKEAEDRFRQIQSAYEVLSN